MGPFIHKTCPAKINRTGDKYLLAPDGDLYQVSEHNFGGLSLAKNTLRMSDLESIGIDPDRIPPTFGVTQMFQLGWLRLNTFSDIIGVTWSYIPVEPTDAQKDVLSQIRGRFDAVNGQKSTRVLEGDGPEAENRNSVDLER